MLTIGHVHGGMKRAMSWALVLSTISPGTAATAQPRPLTTQMPCRAIQALVTSRGAVVLGTGPATYDRYVSSAALCDRGQGIEAAFERAADTGQCFVGYRCRVFGGGRGE